MRLNPATNAKGTQKSSQTGERLDDKNQRSFEGSQKSWMDLLLTLNSLGGRKAPNGIFCFITF